MHMVSSATIASRAVLKEDESDETIRQGLEVAEKIDSKLKLKGFFYKTRTKVSA